MNRQFLHVFSRRGWWLKFTVPAVGLGLAAMTLGADLPKVSDPKKAVNVSAATQHTSLVKPVVFKVKGSPKPLPADQMVELLKKIAKPVPPTKRLAQASIRLPATRPGPLSKQDKHQIIQQANPALKSMGLRPLTVTDSTLDAKAVILTPALTTLTTQDYTTFSLNFAGADAIYCMPQEYFAAYKPSGETVKAVGVNILSPSHGNFLTVYHIYANEAADFVVSMVQAYSNPNWIYETRHLEKGVNAIPVLEMLSEKGYHAVDISCNHAAWVFYSCEIRELK